MHGVVTWLLDKKELNMKSFTGVETGSNRWQSIPNTQPSKLKCQMHFFEKNADTTKYNYV